MQPKTEPARSPSGVHTPRGRVGVREGRPGRRGQGCRQAEEGERALGDNRKCRAQRGEEAAGVLFAAGTAEIQSP